jgi:hypothetical protein
MMRMALEAMWAVASANDADLAGVGVVIKSVST